MKKKYQQFIRIKTATANLGPEESMGILNRMREDNKKASYPGLTNRQWSNR